MLRNVRSKETMTVLFVTVCFCPHYRIWLRAFILLAYKGHLPPYMTVEKGTKGHVIAAVACTVVTDIYDCTRYTQTSNKEGRRWNKVELKRNIAQKGW